MSDKVKMTIWGRELEVGITYDCYSNEAVTELQKETVKLLIEAKSSVEASIDNVKAYCLANNKEDIGTESIENIFKYVAPKYLYVIRANDMRKVAIMCNYKFDAEHGIAVVFENEKFVEVVKQDAVL